jgi:hypothetical protein
MEYTRDLGYCVAQSSQITRQYMIRLYDEDFKDSVALGRCAAL